MTLKIAIIGGGSAGLQSAHYLSLNHDCTIFEKENDVSGVWNKNYDGFGLQVFSELYELIDMPRYEREKSFPDGEEVKDYLKTSLLQESINIKTNTCVISVLRHEDGWNITTLCDSNVETLFFDVCIDASGMYNTPKLPEVLQDTNVLTIHSSDFVDASIACDKKVVVIGMGKSAIDCAKIAYKKGAKKVTLVARSYHWPIPRYIAGIIPFHHVTYSRFGHFFLPKYPIQTYLVMEILHFLCIPVKYIFWRLVEFVFIIQFDLWKRIPPKRIEYDLFDGGQIHEESAFKAIGTTIPIVNGSVIKVDDTHITLNTSQTIACDMIINATGFERTYIFDEDTMKLLDIRDDGLHLYNHVMPVAVPNLFFAGSGVSTFNNILTHGLQARWIAQLISGEIQLPNVKIMMEQIAIIRNWKRSFISPSKHRAAMLQLHMLPYHDKLCEDMKVNPFRKKNMLEEIFAYYSSRDYKRMENILQNIKRG